MIRIDDKYVIGVDQYEYTLMEDTHRTQTDKKTGAVRPVYNPIGHYSTLKSAVEGLVRRETKNYLAKGEYSLLEAVTAVNRIAEKVDDILSKIDG